jgi:cytidylate kinase
LAAQLDRDRRDQIRPEGRLLKAADAMTVRTDDLTILQVVDQLASIVRNRLALTGSVTSEAHDRPEVSR